MIRSDLLLRFETNKPQPFCQCPKPRAAGSSADFYLMPPRVVS